ncbi:DUF2637 domain-containing protein [Actinosynnema sp. NPDC023587]|uniref:DUF2637 domain-containing protein n=1 Tax=Actinosynnema sp. NPDC023587 TaxID=3154695 RepID=UPI0033C03B1A
MTTETDVPRPPGAPGFWERRALTRAQAAAIRDRARVLAEAEAEVLRAQATGVELATADAALVAEHEEWKRQRERDERDQPAEDLVLLHPRRGRPGGTRLWNVVLTVPLLLGSAAAMFGQVAALKPRLMPFAATELGLEGPWVPLVAFAVAFAVGIFLETVGLFMARLAHLARLSGDSPALYRAVMWAVVLYASAVNYHEWSPAWDRPSVLGVLFGSISILSVLGWELREHRADRDRRAEEIARLWTASPIPPRPEFGLARWLVASRHTWTAWKVAVEDRIPDADTALARATVLLKEGDAQRARRRASRPVPAAGSARDGWASRLRYLRHGDPSRWDVDVDADGLSVPTSRLTMVRTAPRATPPVLPDTAPAPQDASGPADRTVLVRLDERDRPVREAIIRYRAEHDEEWPSGRGFVAWAKDVLGVGFARDHSFRVLAAMRAEQDAGQGAGRDATG